MVEMCGSNDMVEMCGSNGALLQSVLVVHGGCDVW